MRRDGKVRETGKVRDGSLTNGNGNLTEREGHLPPIVHETVLISCGHRRSRDSGRLPNPYTLNPYILHPYILHPTPCPTPYALHHKRWRAQ